MTDLFNVLLSGHIGTILAPKTKGSWFDPRCNHIHFLLLYNQLQYPQTDPVKEPSSTVENKPDVCPCTDAVAASDVGKSCCLSCHLLLNVVQCYKEHR